MERQKCTSATTSINKSRIPALFTAANKRRMLEAVNVKKTCVHWFFGARYEDGWTHEGRRV